MERPPDLSPRPAAKYAYSTIDPDESQENDAMNDEYSPSLAPDLPPHVPTDEQPEGEASHPPTVVQVKPLQLQNPIMKRSPLMKINPKRVTYFKPIMSLNIVSPQMQIKMNS